MLESIVLAVITLLGVVITALVTWLIAQRQIVAKHVTAERAKWRRRIRVQALEAHDAILCGDEAAVGRLRSEFRALLNPFDCHDQAILACMTVDNSSQEREKRADEFDRRISLLLKHDWERAKLEAGFFLCRWVLDAKRQPLKWTGAESGERRACKGLRWCEKYQIRPVGALVLVIVVVAVGILACLWCDRSQMPMDQGATTRVPTDVDEDDRASDAVN